MFKIIRINDKKIFMFFVISLLFSSAINITTIADDPLLPDLKPYSLEIPDPVEYGKEIKMIFRIINSGTENVSFAEIIEVGLFLDSDETPVAINSTNSGLDIGNTTYVNISWTPTIADGEAHTLTIIVNYNQLIEESSYSNNIWTFQLVLPEESTALQVIDVDVPDNLVVGEKANIFATIKNNGQDTDKDIFIKLNSSEDGEIQTIVKKDGLDEDETYEVSFGWTPLHFGSQSITVDVGIGNASHDVEEISVNVGVGELEWWNDSWHYRYFLIVTGVGNVSQFLNFTELLDNIGIVSETFEDDTIRIIRYSNDGKVADEVSVYKFNESAGYNSLINATGDLIWNITDNSDEKYYCVYFDVEINPGIRTSVSETNSIEESGNATASNGFAEGWQINIQEPIDGGYTLILDPIDIHVVTDAKAQSATAFIFLTDNESHNFTLVLTDNEGQTNWVYNDFYFDEEGNWTIRVSSLDDAGYIPFVAEHDFLVGKPDLELINISIETDWAANEVIYKDNTINITANVISHDANVEDVNITVSIVNKSNDLEVYADTLTLTLIKEEVAHVYFEWCADIAGDFKIIVTVDSSNEVDESDESNNEGNLSITVNEWPDLKVKDIILPNGKIMEFEEVIFEVEIENKGLGNASDYFVKLYIEEAPSDGLRIMKYEDEKDSKKISIDANSNETVTLTWDSSESGIWLIGVKILVEDGQRDSNLLNNHMLSETNLIVRSYEKNKPDISNVKIEPSRQEQGGHITIYADVTDDTGLEYVYINITDPLGESFKGSMIRTTGDEFKYDFYETSEAGKYLFTIEAIDLSIHQNIKTYNSNFTIIQDKTDPVVSYYGAEPYIQLIKDDVTISCIVTDNTIIETVTVTIKPPNDNEYVENMKLSSGGKYEYTDTYNIGGKYTYEILIIDGAGNWVKTDKAIFWVTRNKDDTDNDGMPDDWEKRYGLDPYDSTDGGKDMDGDGYTNLKEYQIGTHPQKDIFLQNVAYRVKENAWYIVSSIVLFLIILIFARYGTRRKKT